MATGSFDRTILSANRRQESSGSIDGRPVLGARWAGRNIVYRLAADHGLRVGDAVAVEIDWARRYRLMRLHFAAEVVLELVYRMLGNPEKIGAHIAADKARIDFVFEGNISKHFPELEAAANAIVAADHAIISAYEDEANERRYWKIPNSPPFRGGT
jgi:Ser-tRNA(Ala) deacylase AlaX